MTSQPGKQTITIHILPNISRGKDNQTTKFGHLFNVLNVFPQKSYRKWGKQTSARPIFVSRKCFI